jgi:hypothetical protein
MDSKDRVEQHLGRLFLEHHGTRAEADRATVQLCVGGAG